jgi:hypothetical protein
MRRIVFFSLVAIVALTWTAHSGAPKDAPQTLMLQPGKLLVSEDLNQPFGKEWFGNPGKWEVIDGVTRGSERSDDMHAAVRRREVKFTSAVVQFQFRLEGAKALSLSMNAEKGHVCRVRVAPDGFTVNRDKDKVKNEKPTVLDKRDVKIEPKVWHTLVVEMAGKDMVARLDGKDVAFGSHDGLVVPKASVGFTVQGESVSFKNLRVYEGTPLKSWEETRAKLQAERKK